MCRQTVGYCIDSALQVHDLVIKWLVPWERGQKSGKKGGEKRGEKRDEKLAKNWRKTFRAFEPRHLHVFGGPGGEKKIVAFFTSWFRVRSEESFTVFRHPSDHPGVQSGWGDCDRLCDVRLSGEQGLREAEKQRDAQADSEHNQANGGLGQRCQ